MDRVGNMPAAKSARDAGVDHRERHAAQLRVEQIAHVDLQFDPVREQQCRDAGGQRRCHRRCPAPANSHAPDIHRRAVQIDDVRTATLADWDALVRLLK